MRRTYRSKKDTGGGIDHRDMVLSVDDKSSLFDAFYIQNIKQVKREMSCVTSNPYTASNKVRKRKYVKRLKEPEPIRESSESAYLTPEKSIHVNRTPDLFDQLLNSPNMCKSNSSPIIQPRKAGRTYCKKKQTKAKKFNCSSSTDSDKENTASDEGDLSHNTSNIKAYNLVIEKEKISSPIHLDDSINNIMNQLPTLSKLRRCGSSTNNKLSVIQPPLLQNSPECSTPFHEKYRGKSIYKFSPIRLDLMNDSKNLTPIKENKNNYSVICMDKDEISLKKSDDSVIKNTANKETHTEYVGAKEFEMTIDNELPESQTECTIAKKEKDYITCLDLEKSMIEKDANKNTHTDSMDIKDLGLENNKSEKSVGAEGFHTTVSNNSLKSGSLQTTELEPFLGFTINNTTEKSDSDVVCLERFRKYLANNCSTEHECDSQNLKIDSANSTLDSLHSNNEDYNLDSKDRSKDTSMKTEYSFSLQSAGQSILDTEKQNKKSVLKRQSDIQPSKSIENINTSSASSVHSNDDNACLKKTSNNTSLASEDIQSESFYDTCDSDNISVLSLSEDPKPKEAIVLMERMNDSVFQKYYENMADYSLHNNTSFSSGSENDIHSNNNESDYASFEEQESRDNLSSNSSNNNIQNDSYVSNSENIISNDQVIISSSENENSDFNENDEEEKCVSFVTTRRRNEITNDSFLLNLDNSYCSNSSATLDKTVLSNNRERLQKSDVLENKTLINESTESNLINDDSKTDVQIDNDVQSPLKDDEKKDKTTLEPAEPQVLSEEMRNINTRKSSRLFRESMYRSSQIHADENCDIKPAIVLKPGKKWERSLSIYRRMTTMGDTLDYSVLDDESLKTKGRKYRQSVISTMEMQEYQGSLHNESVISRRSTFVSKPSRSTIKIVKDPNASNVSLSSSVHFDDLEGFLNGDCDDTIIELSKLSIGDSRHEVTILDKFHDTSRILTARDYVLRRCNQTEPILFDECYPDPVLKNCRKIGEGVYGEVYLWRAGDGRARVMKIVPIAGATKVNGEDQKDYHEIISEIVIAMELSALRAPIAEIERHLDDGNDIDALDLHSVQNATDVFNEVLAVRCVQGPYPSRLLDLWELYDECKGSENDNPATLPADQSYIVLELANAGQDLEGYQFNNAEQAFALFKQIALGLAVAEEAFQFEHRDLHWGNVLISPTDQKYATFVIRGRLHRTLRCGVAASVIDYSLSRAARGGRALYNDLGADDALFGAVGDYQFEVYRLMRDKLGNDWKNFEPYTNILWLHYTVDKMITALRYTRTNTKIHKHYIAKLKEIKNRVLDYGSATQFVLTDNEF